MYICWTLTVSLWILLGGLGLFTLGFIGDFTAAVMPVVYIIATVILPVVIVGPLWLSTVGARIRLWRLWNLFGQRTIVHVNPALTDIDQRIDPNVAYAYLVEYEAPSWESDIPLEALFTFVLPGTRNLQLRELPVVFTSTAIVMEPILGWLLPYVGVQEAPPPLTIREAFRALPARDVVLINPSDPTMPVDGFVDYDSYFFETLRELEYYIIPVKIRTPRRLEHEHRWYGRFVPAIACLFGVAPASLPHLVWSWWRQPTQPPVEITMGATKMARDLTVPELRSLMETTVPPHQD